MLIFLHENVTKRDVTAGRLRTVYLFSLKWALGVLYSYLLEQIYESMDGGWGMIFAHLWIWILLFHLKSLGVAHLKLFRITAKILSKYDIYNCIFQSEKFPGGSKPNVGESLIIHSYLWQRLTYASCIAPPIGLIPIALMPIACLLTLQLCSKMNI